MSVLAITLGGLILIPALVSHWRTLKRIETAQNVVLGSNNFSPVLLFVVSFIPLVNLVVTPLMQSNLNQVWQRGSEAPVVPQAAVVG
jgi:uncharacterized protein involved in cysteine biosynthesis